MFIPNLLGISRKSFGDDGVCLGNQIHDAITQQNIGLSAQYNSDTRTITALNSSDIPPGFLQTILNDVKSVYQSGRRPVVMDSRTAEGNLQIEFRKAPTPLEVIPALCFKRSKQIETQLECEQTSSPKKKNKEKNDLQPSFVLSNYDNTRLTKEEMEINSQSANVQNLFLGFGLFFSVCCENHINYDQLQIVRYLKGAITLDEIGLTKGNAAKYQTLTKIVDLALTHHTRITQTRILYPNSTYAIRTRILELLSPDLQTIDAYTLTVDPTKLKNPDYLKNPANWVPERIGFYAQRVLPGEYFKTIALSERLKKMDPETAVHALRGATASGKTTLAQAKFKAALDENGELSGSLNLDSMKFTLRTKTLDGQILLNTQVHEEVARGPLSQYRKDILRKTKLHVIYDGRLSLVEEFENEVLFAAKFRESQASIYDLDVPLSVSLERVLALRDPCGKGPCVNPKDIVKAWKEVRQSRAGIIERIKNNALVHSYQLLSSDEKGIVKVAAEKKGREFRVYKPDLFEASITLPSEGEIETLQQQKIDTAYIAKSAIPDESKDKMTQWRDLSVAKAVECQAMGIPASQGFIQVEEKKILAGKFGMAAIQPFSGTWLRDYPQIKEHLESEHRLHVRGADEGGKGLTWQTNKFAWKLNPVFNPEAQGGLQMKLGYFIVPAKNLSLCSSQSLSEKVLHDLEVRNPKGELLGYRFFVHPEAYEHFKVLHDSDIPFVKPEQSEFIGTPTSSYRSWAIRRVDEKEKQFEPFPGSVPFIVKLGVGDPGNTSRLLSKAEVQKSIQIQNAFDQLPKKDDFVLFPENLGLILQEIPGYPSNSTIGEIESVDSGLIVREFPQELLDGTCKIVSFSAVMSMERVKKENQGVCRLSSGDSSSDPLPLIYEIMDMAIKQGRVASPFEFIEKYLITGVLNTLELYIFQHGFSLPVHAQNLCLVLNPDNTPRGIALRDLGDIHRKEERFIETYSWFYKYHVFVKLLNVIAASESEFLPAIPGAPTQIGQQEPLPERSLYFYLQNKISKNSDFAEGLEKVGNLSISFKEYVQLLDKMDRKYLTMLSRYFDLKRANISLAPGSIPAAEMGSSGELALIALNQKLWRDALK
jgi:hypothetical protein